ncbi:hypothetical protein [Sphingopyxis sp. PET50]|uniref:hypothetical protein n=1 Tax=Sphingopyxis sp. PET50 TaxID=2976533 RepID=UPI0021AE33E8|nr:hypothetical protein [Sphingopyxis sp. PET50]
MTAGLDFRIADPLRLIGPDEGSGNGSYHKSQRDKARDDGRQSVRLRGLFGHRRTVPQFGGASQFDVVGMGIV